MTDKEKFIENLKERTVQLSVDTILFCENLKKCKASDVISYQLIKSSTSVGSNYRASCRARSQAEFFSKISIVVEEADETEYWFEVIKKSNLSSDDASLSRLIIESNEITKIMTKARGTMFNKR